MSENKLYTYNLVEFQDAETNMIVTIKDGVILQGNVQDTAILDNKYVYVHDIHGKPAKILATDLLANAGPELTEEFIVTKGAGSFDPGEIFPCGLTAAQAFKKLLTDVYTPTFVVPSFSLSNNGGTRESGETINITLTTSFNRGSINGKLVNGIWSAGTSQNPRAGLPNKYTIDGTIINTTSLSNQTKVISNFVVIEGSTTWSASINYDAGPQPLDSNNSNFGSPLAAGSLSASTSITGYLLRYAGAIQTIPANGVALRTAMRATAVLNTANSFQITTGTAYKYLIVAIPAYKTFVSAQNLGTNEALTFVLSTTITTIPDAAGTPKAYKVYICTNAVPFPQDYTIQITLS